MQTYIELHCVMQLDYGRRQTLLIWNHDSFSLIKASCFEKALSPDGWGTKATTKGLHLQQGGIESKRDQYL